MKYCTKCGTQLSDDTAFCPNCGQSVGTFTPAPAESASAAYQPAPVVVRKLKTNRGMIKYFLLSLITFGIYGLVVLSSVSTDINTIASRYDGKRTMHYCLLFFIVSWLTLGIGVLVWFHRVSARIGRELDRRGIDYHFGAGSYWGWNILGTIIVVGPFVYIHKLLKSMNLLAEDYNVKG